MEAAALLIAFLGVLAAVSTYVRTPDVSLTPPATLFVYFDTQADGDVIVRFAAPMSYLNYGTPGYSATIVDENVSFNFSGKTYRQEWESFEQVELVGSQLRFENQGRAQSAPVRGGARSGHTTAFAPRLVHCSVTTCNPYANSIRKDDFLGGLTSSTLSFRFAAGVKGRREPLVTMCRIEVTGSMVDALRQRNWVASNCLAASSS
jgi:hypothetical protein